MINIISVSKTYCKVKGFGIEKKKVLSLDNINIEKCGVLGLIGANGAGKTTLMRIIAGKLKPNKNSQLQVLNSSVFNNTYIKENVGYYSDDLYFGNMALGDILDSYGVFYSNFDKEKCVALLKVYNLDLGLRFNALSKGMKASFIVCLAVSTRQRIVMLDEPTAFMDEDARLKFKHIIEYEKKDCERLIMISTHLAEELREVIDEAILLDKGNLVRYEKRTGHTEQLTLNLAKEKDDKRLLEEVYCDEK